MTTEEYRNRPSLGQGRWIREESDVLNHGGDSPTRPSAHAQVVVDGTEPPASGADCQVAARREELS